MTSEKSYSYEFSTIRETTKVLSLELTKTFLFLSLWRELVNRPSSENLSFLPFFLQNFALLPFLFSTIFVHRNYFFPALFYFALIVALSPIYANLTTSISSDTILNLAMFSFSLRFVSFDFSSNAPGAVSRNSALFGAIVLSSRLENAFDSVIMVATALILFSNSSSFSDHRIFFFLQLFQVALLNQKSLIFISCFLQFMICVAGPFFISSKTALNLKNNVYGIWDEAELSLS